MKAKGKKLAIIGECMVEFRGHQFGEMVQAYGGDSLNTAVYFSRITDDSLDVSYVTVLGEDRLSDAMLEKWCEEGVDTSWVCRSENRQPGAYLIQLDEHGERTFLYWRNDSAARYLFQHPKIVKIESALEHCDMVFFSGISVAILPEEDRSKLYSLLAHLSRLGVKLVFDTNYRPNLWGNSVTARQVYKEIFSVVDLVFATDVDEMALWGDECDTDSLHRLHNAGVNEIVLKQGAQGCQYSVEGNKPRHFHTTPVSMIVDTTAAGDAFNAGFLARYLANRDIDEACRLGNKIAGIVIQHLGAIIPKAAMQKLCAG